jgi:signal peptidase II
VKRSLTLLASIAGVVLVLDVWTKHWASRVLAFREPVRVVGEWVQLTYTRNSGVAFGLGAGVPFPYYIFSIVAALAIVYLFVAGKVPTRGRQIALALILGGALGNLVDRITTGEVVDFILVGWQHWHWPVFNVADSAVSVGVVLFLMAWPQHRDAAAPAPASAEGPGDDAGPRPLGSAAPERGAAGSLPGRGADGPLA